MLDTNKITEIVNEKIEGSEIFLVEVTVSKSNQINIFVDAPKGVDIKDCIEISKFVENTLDRDEEDFELNVSSAGLDRPLKVLAQYKKNLGQTVQIDTISNERLKGELKEVNENGISISFDSLVKVEGKKKKQVQVINRNLSFEEIRETKIVFSFK